MKNDKIGHHKTDEVVNENQKLQLTLSSIPMIREESIFGQRRFEIFVLLFRFYTAGLHMLIEDFKERLKYMCCYKYKLMIKCIRRPQVGY